VGRRGSAFVGRSVREDCEDCYAPDLIGFAESPRAVVYPTILFYRRATEVPVSFKVATDDQNPSLKRKLIIHLCVSSIERFKFCFCD
jgi:hypothetical protein